MSVMKVSAMITCSGSICIMNTKWMILTFANCVILFSRVNLLTNLTTVNYIWRGEQRSFIVENVEIYSTVKLITKSTLCKL